MIEARGFETVHLGHANVHEEDVGSFEARQVDGLGAVGGLADDFDVGCRSQQHGEAAAHERLIVGDRDTDHAAAPYGRVAATRKPPPVTGAGFERSAVHADAFAHAHQSVSAVRSRGR